jgi:hypothetical protein
MKNRDSMFLSINLRLVKRTNSFKSKMDSSPNVVIGDPIKLDYPVRPTSAGKPGNDKPLHAGMTPSQVGGFCE